MDTKDVEMLNSLTCHRHIFLELSIMFIAFNLANQSEIICINMYINIYMNAAEQRASKSNYVGEIEIRSK